MSRIDVLISKSFRGPRNISQSKINEVFIKTKQIYNYYLT